jgi:hypothetical protein
MPSGECSISKLSNQAYTLSMKRSLMALSALLLLLAVSAYGGDKKKQAQSYQLKPDQTADIPLNKLSTAKQECENWAVAAGLETMLAKQGVQLDQSYWIMRLNAGELCVPEMPSVEALTKLVNREVVLADGRHATLELQYVAGAPTNIDGLIYGLQTQNISLIVFRGHTYYLAGATYDEYIGLDGGRMLQVKELRLANTFAGKPAVTFQRGRDNPEDIQGTMTVNVAFP